MPAAGRDELRARMITATSELLARGGWDAVSTRAIASAAGDAAAGDLSHLRRQGRAARRGRRIRCFAAYLAQKPKGRAGVCQALRAGWDLHVAFGLANPALFSLMYGNPKPGRRSPAAAAGLAVLHEKVRDVAAAGRLRVSERRAVDLMHAAGCGVVFALLEVPEADRDLQLSEATREIVIGALTTEDTGPAISAPVAAANALRAQLGELDMLTGGERHALGEWLDRIASGVHTPRSRTSTRSCPSSYPLRVLRVSVPTRRAAYPCRWNRRPARSAATVHVTYSRLPSRSRASICSNERTSSRHPCVMWAAELGDELAGGRARVSGGGRREQEAGREHAE